MKEQRFIGMLAIIILFLACGRNQPTSVSDLGSTSFQPIGKATAMPSFYRGLLLLHSFEYDDAAEAFFEAQEIDADFVMAYWGEAMSYNHPLWQEQNMDEGLAALNKLGKDPQARVERAQSVLEKDFITGTNILFGKGNKIYRDSMYAQHMENMYNKYPGNDEVAAFYSLALNAWGYTTQSDAVLEKAASIGLEVMKRNPSHPGAIHYVIHAYDNPLMAEKGLRAADKYAAVAPAAGHALHMPSHIYTALGMWDKVVSSNISSWSAGWERKAAKKLGNDALSYHSYHWMQYGHLQQENYKEAAAMLDSMHAFYEAEPSMRAKDHLLFMQTSFLGETLDYTNKAVDISIDVSSLNIYSRAASQFMFGMKAYQTKNKNALADAILKIKGDILIESEKVSDLGLRICGNITYTQATETDVNLARIMLYELQACEALLSGDKELFEEQMQKALAVEVLVGNQPGPPIVTIPPHELYGRWLIEEGRVEEAKRHFEKALLQKPNRLHAKKGLEACNMALAKNRQQQDALLAAK